MTINASRSLDLNFAGRNWRDADERDMFVKFKWNENEYDGNTAVFKMGVPGLDEC